MPSLPDSPSSYLTPSQTLYCPSNCVIIGSEQHWIRGALDQRSIVSEEHWIRGAMDQRSIGSEEHWIRGALDQRSIGSEEHWIRGALGQRSICSAFSSRSSQVPQWSHH